MDLKVLHTGDLHLGMTYQGRGYPDALRESLVESRFRALEQLVETANREKCQLFLVAGDLFHRDDVSRVTIEKAALALARFGGNCLAVLPGNHDFLGEPGPLWGTFREKAPDHLVLLAKTEPYPLEEFGLEAVLYPAPCHQKHSEKNRLGWIRELEERPRGRWHLGVAHGSLRGLSPDFDSRYFPMEEEELRGLGMHHWFLGHTHGRYPREEQVEGSPFAFCGTPEPDGFDCRHGGSAWITGLDSQGNVKSRAISPGKYRFREIQREISGAGELEELVQELSRGGETTLVKLGLTGSLEREEFFSRQEYYGRLEQSLAYLELDDYQLAAQITSRDIEEEFPRDSFPFQLLNRLVEKGEPKALQKAYEMVKKVKK